MQGGEAENSGPPIWGGRNELALLTRPVPGPIQ